MAKAIELPFGADYDVALCMSRKQAQLLVSLFASIGGDNKRSARKEANELASALRDISIYWDDSEGRKFREENPHTGSIWFK